MFSDMLAPQSTVSTASVAAGLAELSGHAHLFLQVLGTVILSPACSPESHPLAQMSRQ